MSTPTEGQNVPTPTADQNGAAETADSGLTELEFADNPEPRCPCVLVLDCSSSMASGSRIQSLNEAIAVFKEEVCADDLAPLRAEVAIIAYNHEIEVVQDFVTVQEFIPRPLTAYGGTRIAAAINKSLDMLEARKAEYRANGIEYFRPIAMLITDGYPEHDTPEDIAAASERVRDAEKQRAVAYFAFGVDDDAHMPQLAEFMSLDRPPKPLKGAQLKGIFQWLSNSMSAISKSQPSEVQQLPDQSQYLSY